MNNIKYIYSWSSSYFLSSFSDNSSPVLNKLLISSILLLFRIDATFELAKSNNDCIDNSLAPFINSKVSSKLILLINLKSQSSKNEFKFSEGVGFGISFGTLFL